MRLITRVGRIGRFSSSYNTKSRCGTGGWRYWQASTSCGYCRSRSRSFRFFWYVYGSRSSGFRGLLYERTRSGSVQASSSGGV
jgi:hypothetical protein